MLKFDKEHACFLLSRTILDVDIESFEEKSWRNPGVDITDYFNFDLNEDSWKEYCNFLVSEVVLIPISHASLLDSIWVFWQVEIYFPKLSMQCNLWVCHLWLWPCGYAINALALWPTGC